MKKYLTILAIVLLLGTAIFLLFFRKGNNQNISDNGSVDVSSEEVPVEEMVFERAVLPSEFEHDQDRDGVSDEKEAELGTSDLAIDTDGDGLRDVDEINKWGTDPTKMDTDGDGFADGVELLNGYNPVGEGKL
ncbi:MAG: hypothetical protein COX81_01850 [Candidatus Magasanikbacteria bacterium CG_4_10_14_0_2_um_filter_37_12]|uniref:EF-hand domain-containing protein n=1 Tax=Candidatus Magasanikbacteria bacterium CG_4_10_14_0_2_um_filter_37_12 TaxID=1974637 RepID=A0A2M7V8E1_9BACT|nr:MAG: hypothetical protein COX81_01850 [Candidatus Magasanikbacteria bacterium CG_4_10_14_0_2_um_filter_37_12]